MRPRLIPVAAAALLAGWAVLAGCGSPRSGPAAQHPAAPHPAAPHTATTPSAEAGSGPAAPGAQRNAPCKPSAGVGASTFFGYQGRDPLTGVQFISPGQGWVVGRRVILATTDGGASWTAQDRGALNLVSVDFVSSEVGWAVGLDTLLTTSDGGRHWSALREPCGIIRSVHFISPRVGYAIAGGINPVYDSTLAPAAGGFAVVTTNGGRNWQPVPAPANPQSVCFSGAAAGWLGADGKLYESADGGRSWQLRARGEGKPGAPSVMFVQCASGSAWALDIGPGAASSQQPHIGFYARPGVAARPIFAEQYFPHPGVRVRTESPSAYAGPMSAISSSTAAFVDWCDVCDYGTAPWALATGNGAQLSRKGNVGSISQASGASFLSSSLGWVVGTFRSGSAITSRIVHTADGGASWDVQYG